MKKKKNAAGFGGQINRYLQHIRPQIGKHKKTKLTGALGASVAKRSLLNDQVANTHAKRLEKQFLTRWGDLRAGEDRLRFWTVLDSLVDVNDDAICQGVEQMFARLEKVCAKVRGLEVIGACEIEIVNIEKMTRLAEGSDQARKLKVVQSMMTTANGGSMAMIHFHGLVDFGMSAEKKCSDLGKASRSLWGKPYQVEIKKLFSTKPLKQNLKGIAQYLTKGGNENLIYKIGFGYDIDDKINRQLLKCGKAKLEDDYEGFENELSLASTK